MTKGIAGVGPACRQGRGSGPPYSNSKPPRRRPRHRVVPPGTIPRGPYAGLPKRPKPERERHLSLDQVINLTNALAFAESQGRPLSCQITVAWNLLPGFDPADWSAHQTRVLKAMSEWLSRRDIVPTFIWTREVSVFGSEEWHHTHLQLYLPHHHQIGGKCRSTSSIARELVTFLGSGFGFLEDGIKEELGKFGMWTPTMRAGDFVYMLKGIDHRDFRYLPSGETVNIGVALGIQHRGTQGVVPIKRAGTSQNLGRAARRAAGWTERRSLEDLRAILRPPEKPKAKAKLLLGRRGLKHVYLDGTMKRGRPRGNRGGPSKGPPLHHGRAAVLQSDQHNTRTRGT